MFYKFYRVVKPEKWKIASVSVYFFQPTNKLARKVILNQLMNINHKYNMMKHCIRQLVHHKWTNCKIQKVNLQNVIIENVVKKTVWLNKNR